jgi:L-alanine-DL-glutamate epimerase-like enolase superfamily enzyme
MAIAAVDSALWDLKAHLLNLPLVTLLGQVRESVPIYGSGGFTSYSDKQLQDQFRCWVEENGARKAKMKIGRDPARDPERVRAARKAIGNDVELYVDANGAYERKQALDFAWRLHHDYNVTWFEEPVSSDDLAGLRLMRDQGPPGMAIAAGEYGYDLVYFRRMLESEAVDVLQADATRCAGITGFLQVGALCEAFNLPLSAHTAPSLHAHPMCALGRARDVEYFHDHVRIERMLFEGAILARNGELRPDLSRPGIGIELKRADAEKFAA